MGRIPFEMKNNILFILSNETKREIDNMFVSYILSVIAFCNAGDIE